MKDDSKCKRHYRLLDKTSKIKLQLVFRYSVALYWALNAPKEITCSTGNILTWHVQNLQYQISTLMSLLALGPLKCKNTCITLHITE